MTKMSKARLPGFTGQMAVHLASGRYVGRAQAVVGRTGPAVTPQGRCVCGATPVTYCDSGGNLHYRSSCYDTQTGASCGYKDEILGKCS